MNLSKLNITSKAALKINDEKITLAKSDKNRWYLSREDGAIIGSTGFASKTKALAALDIYKARTGKTTETAKPTAKKAKATTAKPAKTEKVEPKKLTNLHKIRYGKSMDKKTLKSLTEEIWGGRFKLTNITFAGNHYWKATITDTKTGNKAENTRLDYFLSYERLPRALSAGIK